MLNRRGFLSLFGIGPATAVIDPERLIWVPGRKLISIPRPLVWASIDFGYPLPSSPVFWTADRNYIITKVTVSTAIAAEGATLSISRDGIGRIVRPGDHLSVSFSHAPSTGNPLQLLLSPSARRYSLSAKGALV